MIYKKIQKANLLRKTAFEAAQAGAQGTGIDFDKEDGDGLKKVANPITNKSSALKRTGDPKPEVKKKIVNYKGTAHDYIRTNVNKPAVTGGYTGGGTFKNQEEKDWYDAEIKKRVDSGMSNEQAIQDYRNTFQIGDKKPDTPGSSSANVTLTPRTVEEKTDPSQQYNMSFKNVENANWARGSMRRGLNRDERKDIKNTVQKMRTLDPKATEKYKESMKKSREGSFLGLGIGGDRQERKIKALKDAGILDENYQSIKSEIADTNLQMGTEERKQKIESATMNKYNMGLNEFGDKKPGSSKTVAESGEGYEEYDGPVGDFTPNSDSNIDFSQYSVKANSILDDFKTNKNNLLEGFSAFSGPLGISKKGKLGKNAKAFKNKAGRGAGY